jgi:hypothetical protein
VSKIWWACRHTS